jgi:hypothetical protein
LLQWLPALLGIIGLWAQREQVTELQHQVKSVFPSEISPAQYQQVEQGDLDQLASQGRELVAVVPYIFKSEERGTPTQAPRPMVTQMYPAYFFKGLKNTR